MRSLGSLIKSGYMPVNGQEFFQTYSLVPSLRFIGITKRRRRYKDLDFEPIAHDDLGKYFLHPYFPGEPIISVELLKPIPFLAMGKRIPLQDGAVRYKDILNFDEEAIYANPTFFRPIYKSY
jgi:hypothetical protein